MQRLHQVETLQQGQHAGDTSPNVAKHIGGTCLHQVGRDHGHSHHREAEQQLGHPMLRECPAVVARMAKSRAAPSNRRFSVELRVYMLKLLQRGGEAGENSRAKGTGCWQGSWAGDGEAGQAMGARMERWGADVLGWRWSAGVLGSRWGCYEVAMGIWGRRGVLGRRGLRWGRRRTSRIAEMGTLGISWSCRASLI